MQSNSPPLLAEGLIIPLAMFVDMPTGRLSVNGSDEPSLAIFFPSVHEMHWMYIKIPQDSLNATD